MYNNTILENILLPNGFIDIEKARTFTPASYADSDENVKKFTLAILSHMKLDEKFIVTYFDQLDIIRVLSNNDLSDEFLGKYHHLLVKEILDELENSDHSHLLDFLFEHQDRSPQFYQRLVNAIMVYMEADDETYGHAYDYISTMINVHCNKFPLDFILNNIGENKFHLITVALKRNDISDDIMFSNIDKISYEELIYYMNEFAVEESKEGMFALEKEKMLKAILRDILEMELANQD